MFVREEQGVDGGRIDRQFGEPAMHGESADAGVEQQLHAVVTDQAAVAVAARLQGNHLHRLKL